jgi:hypothetical protein
MSSLSNLAISVTKILHAVKGGPLSYCDKVYSRGNINQKHRIGGVMVSVLASSVVDRGFEPRSGHTSSNNKTLNARLLARVITGCHYT